MSFHSTEGTKFSTLKMESPTLRFLHVLIAVIALVSVVPRSSENIIIVEDAKPCFRLLVSGRRVSERLVRSSLPAASLAICLEACEREQRFNCEALNYRATEGGRSGVCQLLSAPVEHLRPDADLVPDRSFSVYRRDRDGPPGCDPGELLSPPRESGGGGRPHGPWGAPASAHSPQPSPHGGYGSYGSGWNSWSGGEAWSRGDAAGGGSRGDSWSAERPWSLPESWRDESLPPSNHAHSDECFVRWRAGFRLARALVAAAVGAPSLGACRAACEAERRFPCGGFSLRYSSGPEDPCLLAEAHAANHLRPYHDLVPDHDYDVFLLMPVARAAADDLHCLPPGPPPEHSDNNRHLHPPGSECFRRLRSGLRLTRTTVRDSALAGNLAECELLCLRARFFLCRAFSFRFGPGPQDGGPASGPLDSCLLSDWPASELAAEGPRALAEDPVAELYERGSYGLGCEIDRPPEPHPPHEHSGGAVGAPGLAEEVCYAPLWEPAALLTHAVRSSLAVHTEAECRAECSHARRHFVFFCSAISFRSEAPWPGEEEQGEHDAPPHHNCLLSDVEQRDLRPGQDYTRRPGYRLLAWNPDADSRCHIAEEAAAGGHKDHGDHTADHGGPNSPVGPAGPGGPGGPLAHSGYLAYPERNAASTWRFFTVSGRPCRRGTQCTREPLGGFWGCEVEGGDAGHWDYCCRPEHRCGFSEGYDYPWCYVGSHGPEQWRPCSDHYFPYQHSGVPGSQGSPSWSGGPWSGGNSGGGPWNVGGGSGGAGPWSGDGPGSSGPWSYGSWNGGSGGPGHWSGGGGNGWQAGGWAVGGGRRWPVAYLHRELPPNATAHGPGDTGHPRHTHLGLEVGFDNYVDAYRSGYGKKLDDHNMTLLNGVSIGDGRAGGGGGEKRRGWSPASVATSKPRFLADRQFVLGVSLTSGGANIKGISPLVTPAPPDTLGPVTPPLPSLSFEVVDQPKEEEEDADAENEDDVQTDAKASSMGEDASDASDSSSSTQAPLNLAKLQPRLAGAGSRSATWHRTVSSNGAAAAATQQTPALFLRRRAPQNPLSKLFVRDRHH